MSKYRIELAVDHCEAEQFEAWLNQNGHDAEIGSTDTSFVDGEPSYCEDAGRVMSELWEAYCA